jgi:DNA-directed RNA polymerase specialized sigma24 family protein
MLDLDAHAAEIAKGDAGAFAAWLASAEGPLRRSLDSFAAQADVEAVLQEALLRVWQLAPRFIPDGKPNGLLRLARRIARNLALDLTRRNIEHPTADPPETPIEPSEPDPVLRRAILDCNSRLPMRLAAALGARLASAGDRPDRALAEALGMRLNTFLQNVTRARAFLAECLARRGIALEEVWR